MSRVCTLALPQPPCLFVFSWRCTTRPWRAMKVMLVLPRSTCVTEGRLQGPAWNLQSPRRAQEDQPWQVAQRGQGPTFHQHATLEPHRFCFAQTRVPVAQEHSKFQFRKAKKNPKKTKGKEKKHKYTANMFWFKSLIPLKPWSDLVSLWWLRFSLQLLQFRGKTNHFSLLNLNIWRCQLEDCSHRKIPTFCRSFVSNI